MKQDAELWRLIDLAGQSPQGHPPTRLRKGQSGFPIPGQIWVEKSNDRLWRVLYVVDAGMTADDCLVLLSAYSNSSRVRTLRVRNFRSMMQVWELAVRQRKKIRMLCQVEYRQGNWGRSEFPTFEDFAHALRLDPKSGCRIN